MTAANSKKSAKPRGKPWPKGVSGNPKGAPKRGESWAEIIKRVSDYTPPEAAARSLEIAKQLLQVGEGVTLKEAAVLAAFRSMIMDPQPGLFNAFMDRADGKVAQAIEVYDWRKEAAEQGINPDALVDELFGKLTDTGQEGA